MTPEEEFLERLYSTEEQNSENPVLYDSQVRSRITL